MFDNGKFGPLYEKIVIPLLLTHNRKILVSPPPLHKNFLFAISITSQTYLYFMKN